MQPLICHLAVEEGATPTHSSPPSCRQGRYHDLHYQQTVLTEGSHGTRDMARRRRNKPQPGSETPHRQYQPRRSVTRGLPGAHRAPHAAAR